MKRLWPRLWSRLWPRPSPAPAALSDAPRRQAATYLAQIDPQVRASLSAPQLAEIQRVLELAVPQPAPKLVDLRFTVDLLVSRYFFVLMAGKDRRRATRHTRVSPLTQWGNRVAAVLLLMGVNLVVSASLLIAAYLVKSALSIDLLPGHFRGFGN